MVFERNSRNTYENALNAFRLVLPKPEETWVLVTSASHMPRSVGCFRRIDWNILPYPVDYWTHVDPPGPGQLRFEGGMRVFERAMREWIGLGAYYIMGRTDALFPEALTGSPVSKDAKPATIAAQALGRIYEPYGDLAPPIYMSTTYERNADGSYSGPVYSRDGNPTYLQVEAVLCALEGGAAAAVTASGMAAATAVFLALAPGDHVIAPRVMYWALRKWLLDFAGPWGLKIDFFDNEAPDQLAQLQRAIKPGKTRLVWLETPANPTWAVTDIAEAAKLAHEAGALLADRRHRVDADPDPADRSWAPISSCMRPPSISTAIPT